MEATPCQPKWTLDGNIYLVKALTLLFICDTLLHGIAVYFVIIKVLNQFHVSWLRQKMRNYIFGYF